MAEDENKAVELTGLSNSRLSGQTLGKTEPKISFDRMILKQI